MVTNNKRTNNRLILEQSDLISRNFDLYQTSAMMFFFSVGPSTQFGWVGPRGRGRSLVPKTIPSHVFKAAGLVQIFLWS